MVPVYAVAALVVHTGSAVRPCATMEAGVVAEDAPVTDASDVRPHVSVIGSDDDTGEPGPGSPGRGEGDGDSGAGHSPQVAYRSPMDPLAVNLRAHSFRPTVTLGASATPSSRASVTSTGGDSVYAELVQRESELMVAARAATALLESNNALTRERDELAARVEDLERAAHHTNQQLETAQNAAYHAKREAEHLADSLQAERARSEEAAQRGAAALAAAREHAAGTEARLLEDLQDLRIRWEQLHLQNTASHDREAELHEELTRLRRKVDELTSQVGEADDANSRLSATVDELKAQQRQLARARAPSVESGGSRVVSAASGTAVHAASGSTPPRSMHTRAVTPDALTGSAAPIHEPASPMTPGSIGLQLHHPEGGRPRSASSVQRREELAELASANATIARLRAEKAQIQADLAEARAFVIEVQAKTRKHNRVGSMVSNPSRRSRTSGDSDDDSDLDVETEAAAVLQAAAMAEASSARMTPHASSPLAMRSARLLDNHKLTQRAPVPKSSKAHLRYGWFKRCVCCCVCGGRNASAGGSSEPDASTARGSGQRRSGSGAARVRAEV